MEDQLVLDSPDLIDPLSEEDWITSELEVLEVLPTLLAVCFLEIFLNLLKVLLDDTTVDPSSLSPNNSCGATMMEEWEASPFSTLVLS